MNIPLLALIAFFLQVLLSTQAEKCSDPTCFREERPDPACKLGFRRTMDYGVTFYCMEDLLNLVYPGCVKSGGVFVEDCQRDRECVKMDYRDFRSFVCRESSCTGHNLQEFKGDFFCAEKVDLNCRLKRRLTHYIEGVKSSMCLDELFESSNIMCPGLWQVCDVGKNCPANTKTWDCNGLCHENEEVYCEGTGCPSSFDFTDLKYQCKDLSCEYYPQSERPLKWAFNTTQKKWVCQDESSKCGQVALWNDKYVCKSKDLCEQNYLIDCSKCDPQKDDCRVDYPGWCCQTQKASLKSYIIYFVLIAGVVLLALVFVWNTYRKNKLNKELSGNGIDAYRSQLN